MFLWRDAEGRALDSLREGRRMVEAGYAIIRHEVRGCVEGDGC